MRSQQGYLDTLLTFGQGFLINFIYCSPAFFFILSLFFDLVHIQLLTWRICVLVLYSHPSVLHFWDQDASLSPNHRTSTKNEFVFKPGIFCHLLIQIHMSSHYIILLQLQLDYLSHVGVFQTHPLLYRCFSFISFSYFSVLTHSFYFPLSSFSNIS